MQRTHLMKTGAITIHGSLLFVKPIMFDSSVLCSDRAGFRWVLALLHDFQTTSSDLCMPTVPDILKKTAPIWP